MPSIKTNRNRYLLGIYAAIVQENNDPKKLCRLRIKIPSILGEMIHPAWAEPCLPSTEVVTIPPKGAQVWVAFEEGSPDNPIWLGSFMKDTEPHSEAKSGSPKVRSIKTEESLRISLDDNVKEIQIDTGGGQSITLKKTENKIVVQSNQVIEITGNSQVNVSGDTKVTIDGGTVEVNGNSFKVVTTNSYDPFLMAPHIEGFSTFKAGG